MAYKDKEKEKAKCRKYYWKHPFTRMSKSILKRDKQSKVTAKNLWSLAKKQKMICALTGERLTNSNISPDHIIPLSLGGSSEISNIQLVIKDANLAKHYLSQEKFIDLCQKIVSNCKSPA